MQITLNGHLYTTVLDLAGHRLVLVQQSRHIWRVVTGATAIKVLSGLCGPVLVQ